MMDGVNQQLLFKNIEFLIKEQNKKVGEVETEAGVSAGYISRATRGGGSKPGIDFVVNVAHILQVGVDTLLNVDMADLTPTEKYLLSFLEKLKNDTNQDLLDWERETSESLNNLEADQYGNTGHPLFNERTFYEETDAEYPNQVTRVVFASHTFDVHTAIHGDCFTLKMKNQSHLYVMNISKSVYRMRDDDAFAKEIWMCTEGNSPQFLCSNYNDSQLSTAVDTLYAAILENTKHPKVKQSVKYIIDAYMKGDNEDDPKPDFDEEIPF